ncbi:MAG: DUF624 domain-containing protein [Halanaerobiales bacterium]
MFNIFRTDGPAYRVALIIYNLLALNFLWVVFSIPLITIGASTTALFYVTGKILRKEEYHIGADFWKSFKDNFLQATIIWLILVLMFYLVITNLLAIKPLSMGNFLYYMQYLILFEIVVVGIYIFPLLSRYHMTIIHAFKMALFIGNRHLLTTFFCLMFFPGIYYLLSWRFNLILIIALFMAAVYAFWVSYFVKDKFQLYVRGDDLIETGEEEETPEE